MPGPGLPAHSGDLRLSGARSRAAFGLCAQGPVFPFLTHRTDAFPKIQYSDSRSRRQGRYTLCSPRPTATPELYNSHHGEPGSPVTKDRGSRRWWEARRHQTGRATPTRRGLEQGGPSRRRRSPTGVRPIPAPGSSARGASAGKRSPHETCR